MSLFPVDPRTRDVVHYVVSHTAASKLGAVKLNKVLWRADVVHYRRHGRTVTGQSSYIRMPQGPVPNHITEVIKELKDQGKITERLAETPVGTRREFVWLERLSPVHFSGTEVEALHEAIDMVCMQAAARASDQTHDALWKEIPDGAQIPIRAAAVSIGELEPDDIAWAIENWPKDAITA